MRIRSVAAFCATLFSALGCGGATTGPGAPQRTADAAAVASYRDTSGEVRSAAATYAAAMDAPATTLAGCAALHGAYDAEVRPWVAQMIQGAGAMDAAMDADGGAAYADMRCVANAMMAELDAHRAAACTFATLAEDQAEAARHAGAMGAFAAHVEDRCTTLISTMGPMMGGGPGATWGPVAAGCFATGGSTTGATDPVALGQRLFDTGIGADGQPVVRTGGVGMMGSAGCASCHGQDGHGRTTMMFTAPNVTYANLTDPAGMLDPDGTRGPTYTDDLIRRAVTTGTGADGQALATAMPRWQLADQDWADLLAYLKTLP